MAYCSALVRGGVFLGCGTFIPERMQSVPSWLFGLFWVVGLFFCFPINVLWHWWHATSLFLTLGLSLAHLAVILLVLPLYLGVSFLVATLFMAIWLSAIYFTQPLVLVLSPLGVALMLLLYLGLGLLIFGIFVYFKLKINSCFEQVGYLKHKEKISASQKLKEALYDAAMLPPTGFNAPKGYGSILAKVVGKV